MAPFGKPESRYRLARIIKKPQATVVAAAVAAQFSPFVCWASEPPAMGGVSGFTGLSTAGVIYLVVSVLAFIAVWLYAGAKQARSAIMIWGDSEKVRSSVIKRIAAGKAALPHQTALKAHLTLALNGAFLGLGLAFLWGDPAGGSFWALLAIPAAGWMMGRLLSKKLSLPYAAGSIIIAYLLDLALRGTGIHGFGYGLILAAILAAGGFVLGMSARGMGMETLSRSVLWSGLCLAKAKDADALASLLQESRGLKKLPPQISLQLQAELNLLGGRYQEVVDELSEKEPDPVFDLLLIRAHQKLGDYQAITHRLRTYPTDEAIGLLDKLEQDLEIVPCKLALWAEAGEWEKVKQALVSQTPADKVTIWLEGLPDSPRKPWVAVAALCNIGSYKEMVQHLAGLPLDQALGLIADALDREEDILLAQVHYLIKQGQAAYVCELLSDLPEETALELLKKIPPGETKYEAIARLFIGRENLEGLDQWFQPGDTLHAIKALRKLEPSNSKDLALGLMYHRQGRNEEVVRLLEPHFQAGALPPPYMDYLAEAQAGLGNWQEALIVLEALWDAGGGPSDLPERLAAAGVALGRPVERLAELDGEAMQDWSQQTIRGLFQYYLLFALAGQAEACARILLDRWQDQEAAGHLAKVKEGRGEYAEAAALYERAGTESLPAAGQCWFKAGDHQAAARVFGLLAQGGIASPAIFYQLGFARAQMRDWPKAIEAYQKADPSGKSSVLQDDLAKAYSHWAEEAMTQGDGGAAVERMQQAMSHAGKGSGDLLPLIKSVTATWLSQAIKESLASPNGELSPELLQSALSFAQGSPAGNDLAFLIGLHYLKAGEPEKSLKLLSALTKRNPGDRRAAFHKGLAAYLSGNTQYALTVLSSLPDDGGDDYGLRARILMGGIHLREGDAQTAEEHLTAALAGLG